MNKSIRLLTILAAAGFITSCTPNTSSNVGPQSSTLPPSSSSPFSSSVSSVEVTIGGETTLSFRQTVALTVTVTGTDNKSVSWLISDPTLVEIDDANVVKAIRDVESDTEVTLTAVSTADASKSGAITITVKAKPVVPTLTQAMLNAVQDPRIEFSGTNEASFYSYPGNKHVEDQSHETSTYMKADRWTGTYANSITGNSQYVYCANDGGTASAISVNLMNEEEYEPLTDDSGAVLSWTDSGFTNPFIGLSAADFTFDEEQWLYRYSGSADSVLPHFASAVTAYEMTLKDVYLIVESGEIIGVKLVSTPDLKLAPGYSVIQTVTSTVNVGDVVEVPEITKFRYENIHDKLAGALTKMRALTSYTTEVTLLTQGVTSAGVAVSGYKQTITGNDILTQNGIYDKNGALVSYDDQGYYGYHAFSDTLYNSFYTVNDGESYIKNSFVAERAFTGSIDAAKPSFAFAPEIFTGYAYNQETKETTYAVNPAMTTVATTFYNSDIDTNSYGIFATGGKLSETETLYPYVTVDQNGYITSSCFFFDMGIIHGVLDISYSDFDTAVLPTDIDITFEQRAVPTTWDNHTVIEMETDNEIAASAYLESILGVSASEVPVFENVIGDTYNIGFADKHFPPGLSYTVDAAKLWYKVPLDNDYTIESSLASVYAYLETLGYTDSGNRVYVKGNITIQPVDEGLDLYVYIYRTPAAAAN